MNFEYQTPNIVFSFLLVCLMFGACYLFTSRRAAGSLSLLQLLWFVPLIIFNTILQYQNLKLSERWMGISKWFFIVAVSIMTSILVATSILDKSMLNQNALFIITILSLITMYAQRGQLFKDFLLMSMIIVIG